MTTPAIRSFIRHSGDIDPDERLITEALEDMRREALLARIEANSHSDAAAAKMNKRR